MDRETSATVLEVTIVVLAVVTGLVETTTSMDPTEVGILLKPNPDMKGNSTEDDEEATLINDYIF